MKFEWKGKGKRPAADPSTLPETQNTAENTRRERSRSMGADSEGGPSKKLNRQETETQESSSSSSPSPSSPSSSPSLLSSSPSSLPPPPSSLPPLQPPETRYGLNCLFPNESASIDIVAIHGVGGCAYDSWKFSKGDIQNNWLIDNLPEDIPNCRVLSFGYKSETLFSNSSTNVRKIAEMLNAALLGEAKKNKYRPIIFICHSFGGIVAKQALILAHEQNEEYGLLLENTKGILFLGTPHRGSFYAFWKNIVLTMFPGNTRLLKDLTKGSETLQEIARQFVQRSTRMKFRSFYELSTPGPLGPPVVDESSARLNLPNEICCALEADHRTMNKFSGKNDHRYKSVLLAVEALQEFAVENCFNDQKCLMSLKTSDYEGHKKTIDKPVEKTCGWLLEHPKYQEWLGKEGKSGLLHVSGGPGSGKSVISSFLIDTLSTKGSTSAPRQTESPKHSVFFFFCDDKKENQNDAKDVLRGLLHQIFSRKKTLFKHARQYFDEASKSGQDIKLYGLWKIFTHVISDPEAGNIICIIDGLDECLQQSRERLVEGFDKIIADKLKLRSEQQYFKIFLTSRSGILNLDDKPNINLDKQRGAAEDVNRVIMKKLNDLQVKKKLTDNITRRLKGYLMGNAERTFLWVSVVLQVLSESPCNSGGRLLEEAKNFPTALDGVYENIFQKIPEVNEKTRKLFTIILRARRPLTLTELNIAWAVNKEGDDIQEWIEPDLNSIINRLCGPIVKITDGMTVTLVHQTVKDFLLKPSGNASPSPNPESCPWRHSIDPDFSSFTLCRICVWYLLFKGREPGEFEEFSSYAAANWIHHYREAQKTVVEMSELEEDIYRLCNTDSPLFELWWEPYLDSEYGDSSRNTGSVTKLIVAANFGLESMVTRLLEEGVNIDETDDNGDTALMWAAKSGQEKVLSQLLERGAKRCVRQGNGWSALHMAIQDGRNVIARQLIEAGADINIGDRNGMTPLHWAALRGNKPMVIYLMQKGANVNTQDYGGMSTLDRAAEYGHEEIARILVQRGAKVDNRGHTGRTALHWAAFKGNFGVVDYLVSVMKDKGIPASPLDENHRTPLDYAIKNGHPIVDRFLRGQLGIDEYYHPNFDKDPPEKRTRCQKEYEDLIQSQVDLRMKQPYDPKIFKEMGLSKDELHENLVLSSTAPEPTAQEIAIRRETVEREVRQKYDYDLRNRPRPGAMGGFVAPDSDTEDDQTGDGSEMQKIFEKLKQSVDGSDIHKLQSLLSKLEQLKSLAARGSNKKRVIEQLNLLLEDMEGEGEGESESEGEGSQVGSSDTRVIEHIEGFGDVDVTEQIALMERYQQQRWG